MSDLSCLKCQMSYPKWHLSFKAPSTVYNEENPPWTTEQITRGRLLAKRRLMEDVESGQPVAPLPPAAKSAGEAARAEASEAPIEGA